MNNFFIILLFLSISCKKAEVASSYNTGFYFTESGLFDSKIILEGKNSDNTYTIPLSYDTLYYEVNNVKPGDYLLKINSISNPYLNDINFPVVIQDGYVTFASMHYRLPGDIGTIWSPEYQETLISYTSAKAVRTVKVLVDTIKLNELVRSDRGLKSYQDLPNTEEAHIHISGKIHMDKYIRNGTIFFEYELPVGYYFAYLHSLDRYYSVPTFYFVNLSSPDTIIIDDFSIQPLTK